MDIGGGRQEVVPTSCRTAALQVKQVNALQVKRWISFLSTTRDSAAGRSYKLREVMYPVDLPDVVHTDLAPASERFLSALESRPPAAADGWFEIPPTGKVEINSNNVRRLRPFEDDRPDCAVAALHPPDDPARVVALHLHERWWGVDDVLRTSSESRCGLVAVQTTTERLIVFLLSRVVDGSAQEEALFSPHPCTERCKLLWSGGQAVGFYTVKHKGSLCDSWSGRCYLLPVLDTLLVRRRRRRSGFALRMLEDFCSSFAAEEFLGISAPLSPGMAAVCRKFLQRHEEHRERLYEVDAPGGWTQRRNIWLNIRLGRYSLSTDDK